LQNGVKLLKMDQTKPNKVIVDSANVISEENGDVIYVIEENQQLVHQPHNGSESEHQQVYHILEEVVDESEDIYEIVETSNDVDYITIPSEISERDCDQFTLSTENSVETIEIIREDNESEESEEIIYVTTEDTDDSSGGSGFTFMQVGGPDVASEETIETSMIVEIPEERIDSNPMATDHCYTFKRGIKPKDLDKAKTKAAMFGESSHHTSQPYTFILPKNPTTQIIFPNNSSLENHKLLEKRQSVSSKQTRCTKHRWLWQFMKELLFVGDPSIQWVNQREGSFVLKDQDSLAIKWECYKKLHKMKAQVWRQMRYYFGWMEENKIVRPVVDFQNRFQFQEKFYREKFLPYKFRPHADLAKISTMAAGMDPNHDILSRYRHGLKEKVFCFRGCGSQFINKEACQRHESVCTYAAKREAAYAEEASQKIA